MALNFIISMIVNSTLIILLYAVLCGVHIVLSLYSIYKGRGQLTSGRIRKFMNILLITISIGFIYILWNLFVNLNIIGINQAISNVIFSNILIIALVMSMTYLAFLAKDLGEEFGFRSVGSKITKNVKKKVKK